MSFTYDQLKTAIQDYTQNEETSFVNNLPVFIRVAEERILKNVQLTLFRKTLRQTRRPAINILRHLAIF